MPSKSRLTPKQKLFVAEYVKDWNGTQAYLRAFPATKATSARVLAVRMLAKVNVAEEVEATKNRVIEKAEWSAADVLKQLRRVVEFDIRKAFDGEGRPLPVNELADDVALSIAGLKVERKVVPEPLRRMARELAEARGGRKAEQLEDLEPSVDTLEFKIPDRVAALSLAMKHFGLAKDKVEHEVGPGLLELLEKSFEGEQAK